MTRRILRGKPLQFAITLCCLIAFVLFGYDQGVFGGILQNEDWLDLFNHPNDTETGIIVSCYNLGCLVGCVINFVIGDKLGRRKTIWLAMVFVITGAILQATAFHVAHLVIGRIVTGFGTGMKTSTVPMYQSELCDHKSRGRLVSAEVLFVGVGITFAYWFDFGLSFVGGPLAWRLPLAFQIIFAIVVLLLVFVLPESPRWLLTQDREQEAVEVLCDVYEKEPSDDFVVSEIASIRKTMDLERSTNNDSFTDVFKNDEVRTGYRVLLAWGIQFMNQAGGINLIVYYAPSVLAQNVGLSARTSQILGGCINMMFMFGSIVPSISLDKMGRRKTMLWGCSGLSLCMLMVSVLLSRMDHSNGQECAEASVAFLFLYMLIFGMSVNCVPWVYVPEVLPLQARTRGTAIGVSSNWLWNFTVVMISPVITNRLKWKAYLIFMVTNLLFVPVVYFWYPETSNIKLEDIDLIFTQGENPVEVARGMAKQANQTSQLLSNTDAASRSGTDTEKAQDMNVENA